MDKEQAIELLEHLANSRRSFIAASVHHMANLFPENTCV